MYAKSSNSFMIQEYLDMYDHVFQETDSLFDENMYSADAVADGYTRQEAGELEVKVAYRVYEEHKAIVGQTNYKIAQFLSEFGVWENQTVDAVITNSPFYSSYGETLLTQYLDAIDQHKGDEAYRFQLAQSYDSVEHP